MGSLRMKTIWISKQSMVSIIHTSLSFLLVFRSFFLVALCNLTKHSVTLHGVFQFLVVIHIRGLRSVKLVKQSIELCNLTMHPLDQAPYFDVLMRSRFIIPFVSSTCLSNVHLISSISTTSIWTLRQISKIWKHTHAYMTFAFCVFVSSKICKLALRAPGKYKAKRKKKKRKHIWRSKCCDMKRGRHSLLQ